MLGLKQLILNMGKTPLSEQQDICSGGNSEAQQLQHKGSVGEWWVTRYKLQSSKNFSGGNVKSWMNIAERFFEVENMLEIVKVKWRRFTWRCENMPSNGTSFT